MKAKDVYAARRLLDDRDERRRQLFDFEHTLQEGAGLTIVVINEDGDEVADLTDIGGVVSLVRERLCAEHAQKIAEIGRRLAELGVTDLDEPIEVQGRPEGDA